MADAGEIYAQMGQNIGNHLANAMQQYHKEHQAYNEQASIADALSRLGVNAQGQITAIDPNSKDKSIQPIVDPKALELYQTNNHAQQQKNLGALEALNHIAMNYVQQAAGPMRQLRIEQARAQIAATNALTQQRLNPTTRTSTTNPDLNYTHAVNAHNAQVGQIEDYFTNNYGVGPADILNSQAHKGYVFNKNTNSYEDAQKDQTPDAIGVSTGQGFRWLSKDQFDTLKPQAQAWQKLQQNPPDRADYKTPSPSPQPPPTAGGSPNAIMQANQIKAAYQSGKITREDAMSQIQALSIPGLK